MAAPEFVPSSPTQRARSYESPPWRREVWLSTQPGDVAPPQPRGELFGRPGPDQGYVYVLAHKFEGELNLFSTEHEVDAIAGGCAVALKRASVFGRAPVIHDLTVAFTVWGFLSEAPRELAALRTKLFEEVSHPFHYTELRRIVDMVPDDSLRKTPDEAAEAHGRDWRSLLDLDGVET